MAYAWRSAPNAPYKEIKAAAVRSDNDFTAEIHKRPDLDVSAVVNTTGKQLLHLAGFFGHADGIRLLLARKADLNAVTLRGQTPLHFALASQKKNGAAIQVQNALVQLWRAQTFLTASPFQVLLNQAPLVRGKNAMGQDAMAMAVRGGCTAEVQARIAQLESQQEEPAPVEYAGLQEGRPPRPGSYGTCTVSGPVEEEEEPEDEPVPIPSFSVAEACLQADGEGLCRALLHALTAAFDLESTKAAELTAVQVGLAQEVKEAGETGRRGSPEMIVAALCYVESKPAELKGCKKRHTARLVELCGGVLIRAVQECQELFTREPFDATEALERLSLASFVALVEKGGNHVLRNMPPAEAILDRIASNHKGGASKRCTVNPNPNRTVAHC